jgi:hypothetical protein
MATFSLSLKHVPSDREESCAVCQARFPSSEDSGSRVLSMAELGQEPFRILLCGGCHSKWSHGVTVVGRCGAAPRSKSLFV